MSADCESGSPPHSSGWAAGNKRVNTKQMATVSLHQCLMHLAKQDGILMLVNAGGLGIREQQNCTVRSGKCGQCTFGQEHLEPALITLMQAALHSPLGAGLFGSLYLCSKAELYAVSVWVGCEGVEGPVAHSLSCRMNRFRGQRQWQKAPQGQG